MMHDTYFVNASFQLQPGIPSSSCCARRSRRARCSRLKRVSRGELATPKGLLFLVALIFFFLELACFCGGADTDGSLRMAQTINRLESNQDREETKVGTKVGTAPNNGFDRVLVLSMVGRCMLTSA